MAKKDTVQNFRNSISENKPLFEILGNILKLYLAIIFSDRIFRVFELLDNLPYGFSFNGYLNGYVNACLPHVMPLTLKVPITTATEDIHKYFFIVFSEKIRLHVSSESSARQRIHMKNQALFSSKDKSKKLK